MTVVLTRLKKQLRENEATQVSHFARKPASYICISTQIWYCEESVYSGHDSMRYRRSPSLIKSFLCFAIRAYYDPINTKAGYIFELCSPVDAEISAPNFVFSLYYIQAWATIVKWGYQHLSFMLLIVSREHSLAVSRGIIVSLTDSNCKGASGQLEPKVCSHDVLDTLRGPFQG